MAATSDEELVATYQSLCDQYEAFSRDLAADPTNQLLKLKRRHVVEQIDVMRVEWRNIGAFVGDRPLDAKGRPGTGVKITNNDGSVDK